MKTKKPINKCKAVRNWFYKKMFASLGPDATWIQNHIANCPKCQRRLASIGKVNLALSVIKSQPHKLDLLSRANSQAIGVLKHSLRNAPKAQKLKTLRPEPKFLESLGKYKYSIGNTAACIAIIFLMKIGIFSSMARFQSDGQKIVKQYYADNLGQEMADEIFSA